MNNYPGDPETVLLVGGSEGALIEKYQDRHDGGLALCGPLAGSEYAMRYTPLGTLSVPLVAMHTLRDEIVPFRNEVIYALKTLFSGSLDKLRSIPVDRFGHCEFKPEEALGAFGLLLSQVGIPLSNEFEINRALLPMAR